MLEIIIKTYMIIIEHIFWVTLQKEPNILLFGLWVTHVTVPDLNMRCSSQWRPLTQNDILLLAQLYKQIMSLMDLGTKCTRIKAHKHWDKYLVTWLNSWNRFLLLHGHVEDQGVFVMKQQYWDKGGEHLMRAVWCNQ